MNALVNTTYFQFLVMWKQKAGTGSWSRWCSLLQADSAAAPARQVGREHVIHADRGSVQIEVGQDCPTIRGSREPGRDGAETARKEQLTGRQGQE